MKKKRFLYSVFVQGLKFDVSKRSVLRYKLLMDCFVWTGGQEAWITENGHPCHLSDVCQFTSQQAHVQHACHRPVV